MGGLWRADGVLCAAAGFKTKAETPKSCHGEWQSSEQRSGSEVLWNIKQGWRSEKIINSQFHTSDMTSIPGSPSLLTPTVDNIQMEVDSDSEAEKAAREFAQAQERLRIANEARERRREEWKQKEEEEKEVQWIAAIEAATKEVEEKLEREWQAQLQVSTGIHWDSSCTNICCAEGLGGIGDDAGTFTGALYHQGQRGEYWGSSEIETGTEIWNRWTNPGPMGISPAIGADGIVCTASGHLRVCARKAATT